MSCLKMMPARNERRNDFQVINGIPTVSINGERTVNHIYSYEKAYMVCYLYLYLINTACLGWLLAHVSRQSIYSRITPSLRSPFACMQAKTGVIIWLLSCTIIWKAHLSIYIMIIAVYLNNSLKSIRVANVYRTINMALMNISSITCTLIWEWNAYMAYSQLCADAVVCVCVCLKWIPC